MESRKPRYDENSIFDQMARFWNTSSQRRTLKIIEYCILLLIVTFVLIYESL